MRRKKKENVLSIKGPYGGKHCWVNEDLVVISGSVPLRSQSVLMIMIFFISTRSYAALRAADLDWIVGPGCSPGG